MSDLDVFRDEFLPNAEGASVTFSQWRKQQPAEYQKWATYKNALLANELPEPPVLSSRFGKMLMAAGHLAERDDMKVGLSTSGGTQNLEGTVTVTASPVPAAKVTKVEFYVDGVLKSTDTSSPYTYSWNTTTVSDGGHELKARAFYSRNQVAEIKLPVSVTNQPDPPEPPPIEAPPVNTTLPAITGTATEGQTLSVSNGAWTNSPTSYSRQWSRCDAAGANCVSIPSATGSSYTLVAADAGSTIRCWVTAFNNVGASAPAQTAQTGVVAALAAAVPVNSTPPIITGTPAQGSTLSVSNGAWTGSPTSYLRQWRRCDSAGASCANISGATNATYALTVADVGSTIRCVVTAQNASGNSTAITTAATAVVTSPPPSGNVIWRADGTMHATPATCIGLEWSAFSDDTNPPGGYEGDEIFAPWAHPDIYLTSGTGDVLSGKKSYRVKVPIGEGRHEIKMAHPVRSGFDNRTFHDGEETWVSWAVKIADYVHPPSGQWMVNQFRHINENGLTTTGSPHGLAMRSPGNWQWVSDQTIYTNALQTYDMGRPIVEGQVLKVTFHAKWSSNPSIGFMEVFLDNGSGWVTGFPKRFQSTLLFNGTTGQPGRNHMRFGIYRTNSAGTIDDAVADSYMAGLVCASTRAAAETAAFG